MTAGMNNTIRMIALLGLSSTLIHCGSGSKQADAPGGQWKDKMQEMSHVLVGIYPYLASPTEFNAPENRRKIQEDAERLAGLAHNVNKQRAEDKVKKLDKDPFVAVISNTLDRELNLAVEGLRSGKRDFARAVLKNATSMCVRCHSRGTWGPNFVDWEKDKTFQKLKPLEKGELLAAVRRYDQAIGQYETILADKALASNESYDWVKAANSALNVAVRAKQDPVQAEKIVNTILANKSLPAFQRQNAQDWAKAINKWKKDKPKKSDTLLTQAERILKEARKGEDYWGDRSSYIHYLRSSALLHDFLRTEASVDDQAKALFYLGQSYEVVADMGIGDTNEFYYKACIKRSPHSQISMKCYERLEQNIFLDYSGGGQFNFPTGAMEYLRALRELATPADRETGPGGKQMFDRQ
ncbi:MAG: hypothetical protein KDD43_06060 [Bdellovibrionales bacterium]|nr:hypothetical protein [Bdellovibrionales bacterium]